jgi:hypothetical protein
MNQRGLKLNWQIVILMCLVFYILRLLAVTHLNYWGFARYPDESNYYLAGAKLITEQGFSFFLTERSLWNAPLNLILVWLLNQNILLIQLFNLAIVTLASFFIWDIVNRVTNTKTAYIALILSFLYWPFTEFGFSLLSEPLSMFCITVSVWLFINRDKYYLSGVFFALATLARPATILFPVGFFLIALFLDRPNLKNYLKFLLVFMLFIVPYCAKNYFLFGKFKIANGSGAVLYLGNDLRTNGHEPIYYGMNFDTYLNTKPYSHLDTKGDEILTSIAKDRILANPYESFKLYIEKVFRLSYGSAFALFYPYSNIIDYSRSLLGKIIKVILPTFIQAFLVTGAIFSFLLVFKNKILLFPLSLLAYFILLHSALFAIPRMIMPVYGIVIILGLLHLSSKKVILFQSVLAIIITLFLSFYYYFFNVNEVNSNYINAFKDIKKLEFTSIKPQRKYRIDYPNLELKSNQVLILELNCLESSLLTLKWLKSKEKIEVSKGNKLYKLSYSNRSSWQGNIDSFYLSTSKSCSLQNSWLLN